MIIFIDESGIHKKVDHSTFALAYVEFENYPVVEKKILNIEAKLKIEHFHWSKTVWLVKEKFMEQTLNLDFKAKIAIVKNPINPFKEIEKILKHTIIEHDIKYIYIDGQKSKRYEHKIKHILRDKNISVKKLKSVVMPKKYFFDFLRGHFDGDGSFYSYWDKRWKSSYMFYVSF